MDLKKYGKAIASVVIAVAYTVWQKYSGDGHIDGVETAFIIGFFGNALLTWVVPLTPEYRWVKTVASATVALGTGLAAVALNGYTSDELVTVVFGLAQFLGVAVAPAVSDNGVAAKAGVGD